MKTKLGTTLASLLLFFTHSAFAQITISRTNLETLFGVNQQVYLYADTSDSAFLVNVGGPGGPRTYNFSGFQFSLIDTAVTMPATQVPQFVPRYPGDAIAFRQNRGSGEYEYFIYRFLDSAMYGPGEADIAPTVERYAHHTPEEFQFPYPMNYGYARAYNVVTHETTYVGGVPSQVAMSSTDVTKNADGWGTVTIPGFGTFNCLRWREVDLPPQSTRKDFLFFTQEGYLVIVESVNTQQDSGVISAEGLVLLVPASLVSVPTPGELPTAVELYQNYPNPFNPATVIQYSLSVNKPVLLKVYNVLGMEVATLANEMKQPGMYSIEWNAAGLPSGVYFYRLQAGNFVEIKKLVLLR